MIADDSGCVGVLAWSDVLLAAPRTTSSWSAATLARARVVAHPDETLRHAADRMVAGGHGVLPVVDRDDPSRLVGLVSQFDLLRGPRARARRGAPPRAAAPAATRRRLRRHAAQQARRMSRPLSDADYPGCWPSASNCAPSCAVERANRPRPPASHPPCTSCCSRSAAIPTPMARRSATWPTALDVRHHTAVELAQRAERAGLIQPARDHARPPPRPPASDRGRRRRARRGHPRPPARHHPPR